MAQIEKLDSYFKSIELDISQYNNDNNIKYTNIQPITFQLKDLYNFTNLIFNDNIDEYLEDYIINEEERPDIIAQKLYGIIDLWWINLLINNISYYDFPLTDDKISEMAEYLYVNEAKYSSVDSYKKVLTDINDKKRLIKVVKEDYVYIILRDVYEFLK